MRQLHRIRPIRHNEHVHLILCIADHYEPGNGGVSADQADARVSRWVTEYPKRFSRFRDSDGKNPRHTFFYPLEMYRECEVERLSSLCRQGFSEIEVHLHHNNDNSANLRKTLLEYKQVLVEKHGLLSRDKNTGEVKYGFIHGNWALDNSHPDGLACGVNDELDVLRETGCYADFTLPSYPSPTQTKKINSLYYAVDDPTNPKSHDWGTNIGVSTPRDDALFMVQGPLLLDWRNRKYGLLPRIENGCIQATQPPSERRLRLWLKSRVQVSSRPEWFFVKLHTHGAPEQHQQVLLGDAMVRFHEMLARLADQDPMFHFHYVTARELYNLAKAAEAGSPGEIWELRNFRLLPLLSGSTSAS